MNVIRKKETYTIEDIYALPEGERAELIDGQIYYMAPPNTKHQRLVNYLTTEINLYIRKNNGYCEVFPAPFAVSLNKNEKNYVEPDISIICDPDRNIVTVYNFEADTMTEYLFGEEVPVGIYEAFNSFRCVRFRKDCGKNSVIK